jgi:Bacterial archaeo-eukaryotic release factor family 10
MMLTLADVDKLRSLQVAEESVLSLYLNVGSDPAGLRELPARVDGLLAAVRGTAPSGAEPTVRPPDRDVARELAVVRGREWLGHTVAIFVCGELRLADAVRLRCPQPERAVLARRPYLRPLLAALQRCPAYRIAVIDRQQAWLLAVTGDKVETLARTAGPAVRGTGYGGWYGLETGRTQRRVTRLVSHHYRQLAADIDRTVRVGGQQPLVIGGHAGNIKHLLAELSGDVRQSYAGCFAADPHSLTPARASELAGPVMARWAAEHEQAAVSQITLAGPDDRTTVGLAGCLPAVSGGAVQMLLVADEPMAPGFCCSRCGALSLMGVDCPDWGVAAWPVPDLLEEMALRTVDDGGQVIAVREAPFAVAARLRYRVPAG